MAAFIRFILRHRALTAAVLFVLLGLAMFSARTIRLRFQFRDFFDYPANPNLALFKEDNEEFGDPAGYVIAMIEADDVFQRDVLEYVHQLTAALEPDPIFSRIRSLSSVHAIRGKGDDVTSGPLMTEIPATPAAMAELKQFVLASPLFVRRLISADGKTTAVLAQMRTPAQFSSVSEQKAAVASVEKVLAAHPAPPGVHVRITGAPVIEVGVTDSIIKDQLVLMPAVMSVLLLMLFLVFRSSHGIILCMAAVNAATIGTAGIFALMGRPVDLIGSIIPTTILVYGVVDPIFVLTRVLNKLEAGKAKVDAIVESFTELGLPCFLTSLTTALGFAAFVTARAPTVRYYGITVAIGVLLAWVTTMTVLPLLLSVFPAPKRRFGSLASTRFIDGKLASLWGFLKGRLGFAVVATCVVLVIGGFAARKQHINNVYVEDLPHGQAQADVRVLESRLSGVVRLTVHLDGPRDAMKQPAVLKAIEMIDTTMEHHPLVTTSSSLADLVGEANQAFNAGDPSMHVVPASKALVAQYLALVDPADRADFVTDDYAKSHIALLLLDTGSEDARAVGRYLQGVIARSGIEALGVKASLTGNAVVNYSELDSVVEELLYGFVTAFLIIVALQWLMFRSLRIALISIIPNLIPMIACFVTLRLLNFPLKIDSGLVLCISIGGLFNTTIHFAARVRQRVAAGDREPDGVILHAMRATGPASLFSAVTLSGGFAVLLLSSFPGLRALGLLSMVTLLVGFFADMIVTAVLMRLGFNWKTAMRQRAAVGRLADAAPVSVSPETGDHP